MNSHRVDLGDIRRALRCVSDTKGLVRFGTLEIAQSDLEMPIFVRPADLPCDGDVAVGACAEGQPLELRELKEELRDMARELRTQAHQLRDEVRTSIRASVR